MYTLVPSTTQRDVNTFTGTQGIDVFSFTTGGRTIYLVDTPGFNDTDRSDTETLEILAAYLGASYANGMRIHGIIYLHPITNNRMAGSGQRNIEMVKAMCGFSSYSSLALATTRWPTSKNPVERSSLQAREMQLAQDGKFFGEFINQGAKLFRHADNVRARGSARHITAHLIRQSDLRTQEAFRLQREIIDEGKPVGDTAAGIIIAQDVYKVRMESERRLKQLKEEMRRVAESDAARRAELWELRIENRKHLIESENDKQALMRTMQQLHANEGRFWLNRYQDMERYLRDKLAKTEEELEYKEESLRKMRRKPSKRSIRRPGRSDDDPPPEYTEVDKRQRVHAFQEVPKLSESHEVVAKQAAIEKTRQEVQETRQSYQKLQSQKSNIINGTANGIAAGVTGGTIAASK
ncbi:unnamed protein product [Fusarium equiseti]|uniref:G domain-containing protein n=1 Tax=Fusarium equiseti TaxID=61235 RepID=A0A8J2IZB7_FUSEQ|nr:unnamed protein product [Fusarium equiseti]